VSTPTDDFLSDAQLELQQRAREFVDNYCIPHEVTAERSGGPLPDDVRHEIEQAAIAARLNGGRHSKEDGGQGWSTVDYMVVQEQLGRNTNGVSWWIPDAYNVLSMASPEQKAKHLAPSLTGEAHLSYAVTEGEAGSDPSGISTIAKRDGDGWLLSGEKWFVTSGDMATAHIVVARTSDDANDPQTTLFLVDADLPGISVVEDPMFTHAYPHGHPTISFDNVRLGNDAVLGDVGGADDLQRAWFVEERLAIAARCVGAMQRLLEEATAWALQREQGGSRIFDYQGVSFPLADSAADAAAARLLVFEVARLADSGADRKVVHAKASLAKLFASEAAYRCADRAVQVFGGRGYMRSNVAERFLREIRVDRIWEGTSEIQRLIVARSMERRGVAAVIR
jgi:alkylation response protein AidB-like acyl-CoA dehydrogenase